MPADMQLLNEIATVDVEELGIAEQSYGDSWKRRGGVGAFMMLARKWDRIENQVKAESYDIFKVIEQQGIEKNNNGIIDDIRDLRRYLLLVEQEMVNRTLNQSKINFKDWEATPGYVNQDPALQVPAPPMPAYTNPTTTKPQR